MALTSEHVQLLESMQVDGPPVYEEDGLCKIIQTLIHKPIHNIINWFTAS